MIIDKTTHARLLILNVGHVPFLIRYKPLFFAKKCGGITPLRIMRAPPSGSRGFSSLSLSRVFINKKAHHNWQAFIFAEKGDSNPPFLETEPP
ncbi:MAG: hypothetical protein A2W84_12810 [Bacteroidetes bacterium GWC2_40_13]|nr:MAG: hypothetical protein A2W84_12810 [Bacteroidetes bacterium GWC2_40_13]